MQDGDGHVNCSRTTRDPLMQALVARGINLIIPPSGSIRAGDLILWEKGNVVRLAEWQPVIGSTPFVSRKNDGGYIATTFSTSAELDIDAGASLLGRIFPAQSPSASVSGAAKKSGAQSINLSLVAPAYQELSNLDAILDQLTKEGASPASKYSSRRFFIVYRSWRARGIAVDFIDGNGRQVEIGLEATSDLAANLKLNQGRRDTGDYSFLADEPKVFGVTLRELEFGSEGVVDLAQQQHMRFRDQSDFTNSFSLISDEIFFDLEV